MEKLCPSVESNSEAVHHELTLGGILRVFLPVLLNLLKLSAHKLRVLWQLAAWAPIFFIVHTAGTDTGRRAPAATGTVRAAWPLKVGNG